LMNWLRQENQRLKEELATIKEELALIKMSSNKTAEKSEASQWLQQENQRLKDEMIIVKEELAIIKGCSSQGLEKFDSLRSLVQQETKNLKDTADSSTTKLLEECNLQKIILKDLKEMVSELKAKSTSTIPNLSLTTSLTPKWDSSAKSQFITLSSDGLTATKVSGKEGMSGVLLDMMCSTGTYSWNLKFNPHDSWIMVGIIESSLVSIEAMPYISSYGCAFPDSQVYQMKILKTPEKSVQTFKFVLDMNAGKFEILQGSTLIAQNANNNFKGKSMRPCIIIYQTSNTANTVTIVP